MILDKCQYHRDIAMDFEFWRLTHPLPQVVLTFIQQQSADFCAKAE